MVKHRPLQLYPFDLSNLREAFPAMRQARAQLMQDTLVPGVTERNITITPRDGHPLHFHIYSPSTSDSSNPHLLIALYHGSGFCMGTPERQAGEARPLVLKYNAICVTSEYRLAPEHLYPTAQQDAWDALRLIAAHALTELGAIPDHDFIVGDTPAGASLSNTLSHLARDEGLLPPLTGVWLASPGGVPLAVVPEQFRERCVLRAQPECVHSISLSKELKEAFDRSQKFD